MTTRFKLHTLLLACTNLTMLAFGAPAFAQTAKSTPAAESALSEMGSIVVTARRREEKLQDVPIAVSVINLQALKERAVLYYDDLTRLAPGIQSTPVSHGKNELTLTIRSQRPTNSTFNSDPTVGVYFADVVQAHTHGLNGNLYDLSSVQVLKGPQGTLFGRNTDGGAVLITPQAPTDNFGGYLKGTVGQLQQKILEGALNLPVSDKLQVRVGGQINRREGYLTNLYDGKKLENDHTNSWRISIRFAPTDNLENKLVVYGVDVNEAGQGVRPVAIGAPITTRYPGAQAAFNLINASSFYTVDTHDDSLPQGDTIRTSNVADTTTLNLGDITLKNIFGFRHVAADMSGNEGGLPFDTLQAQEQMYEDQYSDEFQVQGKALDQNLEYILGGYYFTEKGFNSTNTDAFNININYESAFIKNSSEAVFGQATYKLPFLPSVSVTAGLRETWDQRRVEWNQTVKNVASGAVTCREVDGAGHPLSPCDIVGTIGYNKLSYNFDIDWHVNNDIMLYFTHRLGYRAGGLDATGATSPVSRTPYLPEIVKDYEVGAKTEWHMGETMGRFNVAAYHQDFTNIQQAAPVVVNGIYSGAAIYNAAKAKIDGVETELTFVPVKSLELTAFWAFSQPKFTQFNRLDQLASSPYFNQIIDATRTKFPGAPKNTAGATIRWTLPTPDSLGPMSISADYYYQSSMFTLAGDLDYTTLLPFYQGGVIPGYGIMGARYEWDNIADSHVDLAFYVKNLTAKKYYYYGLDLLNPASALGTTVRNIGAPRTWSLELAYHF